MSLDIGSLVRSIPIPQIRGNHLPNEVSDVPIYTFDSWSDFYDAYPIIGGQRSIILIYGGINDKDISVNGLLAVHGGINEGSITADYVMFGGGINRGKIRAKKGFWYGGGIFPNVSVGPFRRKLDREENGTILTDKIY